MARIKTIKPEHIGKRLCPCGTVAERVIFSPSSKRAVNPICPMCEGSEWKRIERNERRTDYSEAMRSVGLTRVRGALGGVYWE